MHHYYIEAPFKEIPHLVTFWRETFVPSCVKLAGYKDGRIFFREPKNEYISRIVFETEWKSEQSYRELESYKLMGKCALFVTDSHLFLPESSNQASQPSAFGMSQLFNSAEETMPHANSPSQHDAGPNANNLFKEMLSPDVDSKQLSVSPSTHRSFSTQLPSLSLQERYQRTPFPEGSPSQASASVSTLSSPSLTLLSQSQSPHDNSLAVEAAEALMLSFSSLNSVSYKKELVASPNRSFEEAVWANLVLDFRQTEAMYVKHLLQVMNFFVEPAESIPNLPGSLLDAFAIIRILTNFHVSFLDGLQGSSVSQALAPVASHFLKHADSLAVYGRYINAYDMCLQDFDQYTNHPHLQKLVQEQRAEGRDLISYLMFPVQRVSQYEQFIKNLMQRSSQPDLFTDAYNKIHEVAESVFANVCLRDISAKLLKIQSRVQGSFPSMTPGRKFICEGVVKYMSSGLLRGMQICDMTLFSDLMVWATIEKDCRFQGAILVTDMTKASARPLMAVGPLNERGVPGSPFKAVLGSPFRKTAGARETVYGFEIIDALVIGKKKQRQKKVSFVCDEPNSLQWLEAIKEAIAAAGS